MKTYKHSNGRIVKRSKNGRFSNFTLNDFGMSHCEKCGAIFVPDFSSIANKPFLDPMAFNRIKNQCTVCSKSIGGDNNEKNKDKQT